MRFRALLLLRPWLKNHSNLPLFFSAYIFFYLVGETLCRHNAHWYFNSFMKFIFRYFWLMLCTLPMAECVAQQANQSIDIGQEIVQYGQSFSNAGLFIHFDKTTYTNSEKIWFSAYLTKADSAHVALHHTLSIALFDDVTNKVNLSGQFAFENGLCAGSLSLLDTIAPGAYHIIGYTNLLDSNGQPTNIFRQAINIKTIVVENFKATLALLDTDPADSLRISLNIEEETKRKSNYNVNIKVGNLPDRPFKASKTGQNVISIARGQITPQYPLLIATIKNQNEIKRLQLKLPAIEKDSLKICFYPEGGNLSANNLNTVGWEAKSINGEPARVKGILLEDNKVLDTIQTLSSGMNKFRMLPKAGKNYTFKLIQGNPAVYANVTYQLPPAINHIVAMNVSKAVVDDTIKIQVRTNDVRKMRLLLHNYRSVYADVPLLTTAIGRTIKIGLADVPRGVFALTLLDSIGRPESERLFFSHYNQEDKIIVNADKAVYHTKETVQLKLNLSKYFKDTNTGIVSISCVQQNRLQSALTQDIQSFHYLSDELGDMPTDHSGRDFRNVSYIEDILLVKGWRKYSWTDMLKTSDPGSSSYTSAEFKGKVTRFGKKLKRAVKLSVLRGNNYSVIETDNSGKFILTHQDLRIEQGKKVVLNVNESNKENYQINIENPYIKLNESLNTVIESHSGGISILQVSNDVQGLAGFEKTNMLKEVVIKAQREGNIFSPTGHTEKEGRNRCGDYLCVTWCLNCPFSGHTWKTYIPEKGKTYMRHIVSDNRIIQNIPLIYQGCELETNKHSALTINGINYSSEKYSLDEAELSMPAPAYSSTLLWSPLEIVTAGQDKELKFFTGDITGTFQIIVQGISDNSLLYETKTFTVAKK